MKKMMIKQQLLLVAGVIIALMLWGLALALSGRALVSTCVPLGFGVIFAGLFAVPVWRGLISPRCTDRGVWSCIPGSACYVVVAIPVGISLLL